MCSEVKTQTGAPFFNAFRVHIPPSLLRGLRVIRTRKPADNAEMFYKGIANRWQAGEVLAVMTTQTDSPERKDVWVLESDTARGLQPGWLPVNAGEVPVHVLLTFFYLTKLSGPDKRPAFRGTHYRSFPVLPDLPQESGSINILRPVFSVSHGLVTVDVSATRVERFDSRRKNQYLKYYRLTEGEYRETQPHNDEYNASLFCRSRRFNRKSLVDWVRDERQKRSGELDKRGFLEWLTEAFRAQLGIVFTPENLRHQDIRTELGRHLSKSALTKGWLAGMLKEAFGHMRIHFENHLEKDRYLPGLDTDALFGALKRGIAALDELDGLVTLTGQGASGAPGGAGEDFYLLLVDRPDNFQESRFAEDTKPGALVGKPENAQSMTLECFGDIRKEHFCEATQVAGSVIWMILARFLIKTEIVRRQLLASRQWYDDRTVFRLCRMIFVTDYTSADDRQLLRAVHLNAAGRLTFVSGGGFAALREAFAGSGIDISGFTVVVIRKTKSVLYESGFPPETVEIAPNGIKAIPTRDRSLMTAHMTGVQVLEDMQCFYSAYYTRPASGTVSRSCLLYELTGGAASRELFNLIVSMLVDASVRPQYATVGPALFTFLNEFDNMEALRVRVEEAAAQTR